MLQIEKDSGHRLLNRNSNINYFFSIDKCLYLWIITNASDSYDL